VNEQEHPNIEATGKFSAVGRFVYTPDGKWCGTPRSIPAAARVAKALEYLRTTDDVSWFIIEAEVQHQHQERHYPR